MTNMSYSSFTDERMFEIFQNFMRYPKVRQYLALDYARKYYAKVNTPNYSKFKYFYCQMLDEHCHISNCQLS